MKNSHMMQQAIGISFVIIALSSLISNLSYGYLNLYPNVTQFLLYNSFSIIIPIAMILTIIYRNKYFKWIQPILCFLSGILSLPSISTVHNVYPEIFFTTGFILLYYYGLINLRIKKYSTIKASYFYTVAYALPFFIIIGALKNYFLDLNSAEYTIGQLFNSSGLVFIMAQIISFGFITIITNERLSKNASIEAYAKAQEYIDIGKATKNVLHNIRTNELKINLELVKDLIESDSIQDAKVQMKNAIGMLVDIESAVENLVTINRFRHSNEIEEININLFLTETIDYLQTLGKFKNTYIKTNFDLTLLSIHMKKAELILIIESLINTALSATGNTDEKNEITIKSKLIKQVPNQSFALISVINAKFSLPIETGTIPIDYLRNEWFDDVNGRWSLTHTIELIHNNGGTIELINSHNGLKSSVWLPLKGNDS
jgi:hypothetical protein